MYIHISIHHFNGFNPDFALPDPMMSFFSRAMRAFWDSPLCSLI